MTFVGLDIETGGDCRDYMLQPWRVWKGQSWITSFAAVDEHDNVLAASLNPTIDQLKECLDTLATMPDVVVVGSNMKFDVAWFIALGLEEECRKLQWMDVRIIRKGLENNTMKSGWGLKPTVARFMPEHAGYEKEVGGRYENVDETLLEYNTNDSRFSAKLARIMWDRMDPKPQRIVQVICQCIPAFARAWLDGVNMSRPALADWERQCRRQMEEALARTDIPAKVIKSSKQLITVLTEHGFELVHQKTGKPSVDKSVLSLYADDERIIPVRDYKRADGSISRYIENSRKCMEYHGEDLVRCDPDLWGTYTGRCTYSSKQKSERPAKKNSTQMVKSQIQIGVALHQWPKKREGKIARSCIVAPPGYLLAEYDFSNQESRIMADVSQDRTMMSVFNEGKDFHCIMGAKAARMSYEELLTWYKTGDKEAEKFRQMGKVANLSLTYRTGAKTFQTMARTDYDVFLTFDEAAMLCTLFKQTYPGVVRFWDRAIQIARAHGYAETRGGRRVYLDWNSPRNYAAEQTAINFPVQGTGADMKFLGLALTDVYARPRGARFVLEMHDALFYVIPENGDALETARGIHKILNNLPYQQVYDWTPIVPMPVDGKIGPSWGELEDIT